MEGLLKIFNIILGGTILGQTGAFVRKVYFKFFKHSTQKKGRAWDYSEVIDTDAFINRIVGGLTLLTLLITALYLTDSL